jgi:hypothetical protein
MQYPQKSEYNNHKYKHGNTQHGPQPAGDAVKDLRAVDAYAVICAIASDTFSVLPAVGS